MAVPNLAPGYLNDVRRIRAEREEAEKQRAFQANEATKEFGRSLGRSAVTALLNTGVDIAGKAFDNYQREPLELAKEGAYIPDSMLRKQALSGLAKSVLGDGFKSGDAKPLSGMLSGIGAADVEPPGEVTPASTRPAEPETNWPIRRGSEKTPYKPSRSFKPPAVNAPVIPDTEAPTFKAGLPDPEGAGARATPGSDQWGMKPTPEAPADTAPIEAVPVEAPRSPAARSAGGPIDVSKALRSVAAARNRNFDQPELSSRERGLYEASQSVLAQRKADAAQRAAAAQPKVVDPNEARKLQLEADKLERESEAAKAAQVRGTPEYEARRTKAWSDAYAAVGRTEQRVSGSSSLLGGGSGMNKPRAVGVVVDDGEGWPRVVAPDEQGRFIYHESKDSQIQYEVIYDKKLDAYRAVNARRVQRDPVAGVTVDKVPVTTEPPATTAAPTTAARPAGIPKKPLRGTPEAKPTTTTRPEAPAVKTGEPAPATPQPATFEDKVRALGLDPATATEKQIRNMGSDTELKVLPPSDRVNRRNEANKLADEAARRAKDAERAASTTKEMEARRITYSSKFAPLAESYQQALDASVKPLIPEDGVTEGAAALSAAELRAAARGAPAPSDMEPDDAALYAKKASELATARKEATRAWMVQNLPALRELYRAQGGTDGQFYQDVEARFGFKLPVSERPSKGLVPPGPAETSPGQLPPPGQSSAVEDLFHRVNAQPWSAAKKRRVFLATAQRDGLV